ncbi:MAG: fused MFS/spermidine synthase [Chitinivibrionales bacterium]|nr:fused MFS/spermidine synthase [Chitinivibrionales bacterium]
MNDSTAYWQGKFLGLPVSATAVVLCCFFFSGAIGLLYEIIWLRRATLIFGTTVPALSVVAALFFAGLAIGNCLLGTLSKGSMASLQRYAILELIIGGFVIANPWLFSVVEKLYHWWYPTVSATVYLDTLARICCVSLAIAPVTILMGGTGPMVLQFFTTVHKSFRSTVLGPAAVVYAVNTAGAVGGCLVTGLLSLPTLGMYHSTILGATGNILIGICLLYLHKTMTHGRAEPVPIRSSLSFKTLRGEIIELLGAIPQTLHDYYTSVKSTRTVSIVVIICMSGFIAMGAEMLWTRFLSLLIHNTVYTYTLSLAVVLSGITIGSMLIATTARKSVNIMPLFSLTQLGIGIATALIMLLPAHVWRSFIDTQDLTRQFFICAGLMIVPSILSGMAFPLAVAMVSQDPNRAGVSLGVISAASTAGGILGSLFIGLYALSHVGMQTVLLALTAASVCCGICAFFFIDTAWPLFWRIFTAAAAAGTWLFIVQMLPVKLPRDYLAKTEDLIAFKEGRASFLSVVRKDNDLFLEIDRLWQGQKKKTHQIMAAHVPALLHQKPDSVLVIGLGVGQTAQRFLSYPIKKLDCIEIEPDLVPLIRTYFNGGWLDDPRVHLLIDDGRTYCSHTRNRYDIISLEIGQTFRPNLASFYTVDFYKKCKTILMPNGLISQFVPMASFGQDEFCGVVKSFITVFPQAVLWYNSTEFLLIGSEEKQPILTQSRLRLLKDDPWIYKDLAMTYWGGPRHELHNSDIFLAGFISGPGELASMGKNAKPLFDDKPTLEYAAAKTQSHEPYIKLFFDHFGPVSHIATESIDSNHQAQIDRYRRLNINDIIAHNLLRYFHALGNTALLEKAVKLNPESFSINYELGTALRQKGDFEGAAHFLSIAASINPTLAPLHNEVGILLAQINQTQTAEPHFLQAIQLDSINPKAYNNYGIFLANQGRREEAMFQLKKALSLNPRYESARKILTEISRDTLIQ